MIRAFVVIVGLSLCGAAGASAQSVETSPRVDATLTIERAMTVSSVQPMTFGRSAEASSLELGPSSSRDAVIRVTGDPGRVYRVTLPRIILAQPGDVPVTTLSIYSDNAGDITQTLTARTDSNGVDRLHVRGRLEAASGMSFSDVTSAVPVGVDYE